MTGTDLSAALSNSLSLGSILILAALGLAITFGVMRVINMAHGDLMMLGAYTALVVTNPRYLGLNIFVAIPAAFLVVGLVGFFLEIALIRHLYGRPLDTLLATWGVGLILQQAVNLGFGPNLQGLPLPKILRENVTIGARFTLADVSLAGLRQEEVPEEVLAQLKALKEKQVRFEITDEVLAGLRDQKVPEQVLSQVSTLKGKEFDRESFEQELTE